jgi:hypothetical protein
MVAVCVVALLSSGSAGAPVPSRAEGKAYKMLDETRRLPTLDRGAAERVLASPWPAPRRRPPDRALADREARRQVAEASCDADVVVIGRVDGASAFPHPNGRWILTAHDVVVTRTVRAKHVQPLAASKLRYIHPSGELTVGGRRVRTAVDWFPPLVTDEELLFFLVRVGKSGSYRTSLRVPPLVLRGGALRDPGATADGRIAALDGTSAVAALRAVGATVCRPPPRRPERRPSDEDWPWPEPPL